MNKMFTYNFSDKLRKKVSKLAKKDRILALVFKRKLQEVISHDSTTIDMYKNLKSPMQIYKRIHLTDQFILLFHIDKNNNHIVFMDIAHWDTVYRK